MYSKEDAQQKINTFWLEAEKYIGGNKSLFLKNTKWTQYKTAIKHIYFRCDCTRHDATIRIDIQHKDTDIRHLFFEQFLELKTVFETTTQINWIWKKNTKNQYENNISSIYVKLENVDIYDKKSWHKIFFFYAKYLVKLDEFWFEFHDVFKQLSWRKMNGVFLIKRQVIFD